MFKGGIMKMARIISVSFLALLALAVLVLTPVIGLGQPVANEYRETFVSPISGNEIVIIKDLQREKTTYEDQRGIIYSDKQEILKEEAFELYEDTNLLKLDNALRNFLREGDPHQVVPVIIVFTEQPAHEVSRGLKAGYEQKFEEIQAQQWRYTKGLKTKSFLWMIHVG
jgi:hypothetical protein